MLHHVCLLSYGVDDSARGEFCFGGGVLSNQELACTHKPLSVPWRDMAAEGAMIALEEAVASIAELVDLEDYYFGGDKEERKKRAVDTAIACAETALTCAEKPAANTHAKACCIKGRALAFLDGHERQAEEFLSKALKLNPQLVEAWNALGEVYWNQQSYQQAQRCFEQALELCGPNAVSLRNLSMVLRAVDGDDSEKAANYVAGLQRAKEATVLDANDPQNWETLGNAYMGDFFVNGKRLEELNKALLAYAKAESAYERLGKRNPTMHTNRGTAAMFLEDYDLAIRSFKVAHEIGAARGGEDVEKVVELVRRLAALVERKGDLKAKRLKELTTSIPDSACTLQELCAKGTAATSIVAKVVSVIDRKDDIPVILVCCDTTGEFFVLSLYNAEQAKVAESLVPLQSSVEVRQPHYRQVRVNLEGVEVSYPCIRVAHPADVSVVGGHTLAAAAIKPAFSSARAKT